MAGAVVGAGITQGSLEGCVAAGPSGFIKFSTGAGSWPVRVNRRGNIARIEAFRVADAGRVIAESIGRVAAPDRGAGLADNVTVNTSLSPAKFMRTGPVPVNRDFTNEEGEINSLFLEQVKNGMELIIIDPRRSNTSS